MIEVRATNGDALFFDPKDLVKKYRALAIRITSCAAIEVLVQGDEGLAWTDITEVEEIGTIQ